jgi:hypothetical protein
MRVPPSVETEFRRMAQECLRLAQRTASPEERLLLLDMAQAWLTLANNTEKLTARRRSSASEGGKSLPQQE